MTLDSTTRASLIVQALAKAALLGCSAAIGYLSFVMFHDDPMTSPTWLASVMIVVAMLRASARQRSVLLGIGIGGIALGGVLAGASLAVATGVALACGVEAGLGAWMIGRAPSDQTDLRSIRSLLAIFMVTIFASAIAAMVAATIIPTPGRDWGGVMATWFAAHGLGPLFLLPLVLTVDRAAYLALAWSRKGIECLLIVLLAAATTSIVFEQSPYPLLFVLFPVLTFAVFRLLFDGIALVVLAIAVVAGVATYQGHGPIAHNLSAPVERLVFLQFLLAVMTVSIMPLASILTDRTRLAALLASSEHLYRLLADNSNDMIVRIGLDGKRRYVSPASLQILGFTPDEMVGETPIALIHVEDRARVQRVCRSLLEGAIDPVCVYRQRRADGGYATLEATYRLVTDAAGQPREFVASVRDIGRRRAAELEAGQSAARLEESNRLLTMAEAMAGVGHWRLDAMTEDLFWSPAVYAIHGLEPDGDQHLLAGLDAYHPDDRDMVAKHVERALTDGIAWHHSARIVRPDGSIRHVSAQGQAERAPDGTIVGLFGVFLDITERVEAEAALIAARDEAQASTEAKSTFLATMSHEIRTPMTGVLGMIELIRTDPDSTERERYFDSLEQSASLLMTILDDILDFSKIESRNLILETVDFDLADLARRTLDLFHQAASSKGLLLALNCTVEATRLRGDPTRLQQIISNLVSNAIKFTPSGRIDVTLTIAPDGRRPRVRCEVADTGDGIARDKTVLLFEPFVQADASTTRRFGGTGLGLAITRRLVEAMHGKIGVESEVGAGSTFWFEITLDRARDAAPASRKQRAAPGRPLSILLAEDNAINQALISALVRRDGHAVTCVENGKLAVEAASARHFDVILMDMQMPQMDGMSATRLIRSGGGPCAEVPIIALTADASIERRSLYEGAGLSEFLTKPVDSELLTTTLAAAGGPVLVRSTDTPVLDDDKLGKLEAAIGPAQVNALLQMLADDLRARPAMIEKLIGLRNFETAAAEAHALKGAALGVGAQYLGEAAEAMETVASAADPDRVAQVLSNAALSTLLAIDARDKRRRA